MGRAGFASCSNCWLQVSGILQRFSPYRSRRRPNCQKAKARVKAPNSATAASSRYGWGRLTVDGASLWNATWTVASICRSVWATAVGVARRVGVGVAVGGWGSGVAVGSGSGVSVGVSVGVAVGVSVRVGVSVGSSAGGGVTASINSEFRRGGGSRFPQAVGFRWAVVLGQPDRQV